MECICNQQSFGAKPFQGVAVPKFGVDMVLTVLGAKKDQLGFAIGYKKPTYIMAVFQSQMVLGTKQIRKAATDMERHVGWTFGVVSLF